MRNCPFCAEEIRAAAIKCKHCGTMLDGAPAPPAPLSPTGNARAPIGSPRAPVDAQPEVFFEGAPSWVAYFGDVVLPTLVLIAASVGLGWFETTRVYALVPVGLFLLLVAYWYLRLRSERIYVSDMRVETQAGIVARRVDSLELWRVHDIRYAQTLADRLLFRSRITLWSQDQSTPQLHLVGLPGGRDLYTKLRDAVDKSRRQRGVLGIIE